MRFLLIVLFGAVLGSLATFVYIYFYHADPTEQAMMRDLLVEYLPFLEGYLAQ